MKKTLLMLIVLLTSIATQAQHYAYRSVDGDPMKTRIYTLKNGLTIYLSNYPEQPRIQTYIAVRAGGKNDPAESTGLAHYLEHLMFKGTSQFGTSNYAAERPLLDQIEQQYEVYGHTTNVDQRKAIYHTIDSLSYEASRHAIANEYDKLMAGIGSTGSNAYTDVDVTCYIEDIPANEVTQWAKIQSNRFMDMVIRGFHTELEAVYEEFNIHLTSDFDKLDETINRALFPHHPYGTQTVIGTQEHLKNPSLQNVWNFYHQWYAPNNVAICMSGDLGGNPDSIVNIIDQYFGEWKANDKLPHLQFEKETTLDTPIYNKVYGREREMVAIAWRVPAMNERDYDKMLLLDQLLYNEKAGLIDLDLNQSQAVMMAEGMLRGMADYSTYWMIGLPKEGQTLEQVRDLMLREVEKVKAGKFNEKMLDAIVNNMRRQEMEGQQSNSNRANEMVEAFINHIDWKDKVTQLERISKLTKQDIIDFARQYLTAGYACAYKYQGEDPNEKKIEKPQISPIEMNRDKQSNFVSETLKMPVEDIAPVFIDFDKDMSRTTLQNGNTLLYKKNEDDGLFNLQYLIECGTKQDKRLDMAIDYLQYLGTKKMSAEALQSKLYSLACDVDIRAGERRTTINISGLQSNMKQAMELVEQWLSSPKPDKLTLMAMKEDVLKMRADDKLEQKTNFARLNNYAIYGADNASTHILSNDEIRLIKASDLLNAIRSLKDYKQTILYYGPSSQSEVENLIAMHNTTKQPIEIGEDSYFKKQVVTQSEVIIAPYDAKNIYMRSYSNNGQPFNASEQARINLFNEYFGGGMNTIVFQELREARGLAYSASALYQPASRKDDTNSFYTNIISQNDKMGDCIDVFNQITEDMPLSEGAFKLSKDAILKRMATERTTRFNILPLYLQLQELGITTNPDQQIYNEIKQMTLQDLADFHHQNVKGRTYRYLILGDEKELDIKKLESLGTIKRVTTEQIFGY